MDRQEIIQRVAAGLRKMGCQPDAFILSPAGQVWDEISKEDVAHVSGMMSVMLGIPVYHLDIELNFVYNEIIAGPECYFMPIWFSERSNYRYFSKQFFLGWEEYCE